MIKSARRTGNPSRNGRDEMRDDDDNGVDVGGISVDAASGVPRATIGAAADAPSLNLGDISIMSYHAPTLTPARAAVHQSSDGAEPARARARVHLTTANGLAIPRVVRMPRRMARVAGGELARREMTLARRDALLKLADLETPGLRLLLLRRLLLHGGAPSQIDGVNTTHARIAHRAAVGVR
jgi:hypothetical protein